MELDLSKVVADGNNRIAVEDLELLQRCCDICEAKKILEIGSADGGSSIVLGDKAKQRAGHLYCIEMKTKQRMVDNMAHYGLAGNYTLLPNASPWIPGNVVPPEIDLLFIDGRHDTRWALVDYHYFEPRVRVGGVIIFHDTSGHCAEDRRRADYGNEDYVPLVVRAVNLIMETDGDKLEQIDQSFAVHGGAIAFRKESL